MKREKEITSSCFEECFLMFLPNETAWELHKKQVDRGVKGGIPST
jgi:hypothetical protein